MEGYDLANFGSLAWKISKDSRSDFLDTQDPRFKVQFDKAEPFVDEPTVFEKHGVLAPEFDKEPNRSDYLALNPKGYIPRRDFVVVGENVESVPVGKGKFYLFGDSVFYRFGGNYDRNERKYYFEDTYDNLKKYIDRYRNIDRPKIRISGTTIAMNAWRNWDHNIRQGFSSILKSMEFLNRSDLKNINLVVTNLNANVNKLLIEMGFDSNKIFDGERAFYNFENILLSPANSRLKGVSMLYPRTAEFLKQSLGIGAEGPEKIYVSRKLAVRRRVVNESSVEDFFLSKGFVCLDPGQFSLREQIRLFSQAKVIVGPHGMGLANAIFSPNLKLLIEIMPSSWLRVSYLRTAQLRRAAYGVFVVNPDANGQISVNFNEFSLFFEKLIKEAL